MYKTPLSKFFALVSVVSRIFSGRSQLAIKPGKEYRLKKQDLKDLLGIIVSLIEIIERPGPKVEPQR